MTVTGATIAPIRPIIEQEFMTVVRTLVGHCSAVNMYNEVNAHVIEALPNMKNISTITWCSSGIHGVTTIAMAAIANVKHIITLRFILFNSGSARRMAGISMPTTNMKLVYRF